jgi:hypothetical protein
LMTSEDLFWRENSNVIRCRSQQSKRGAAPKAGAHSPRKNSMKTKFVRASPQITQEKLRELDHPNFFQADPKLAAEFFF